MATTYQKPDVLVYQKFISAFTTGEDPVLQSCIVGPSFQVEKDKQVCAYTKALNKKDVITSIEDAGGTAGCYTQIKDNGKIEDTGVSRKVITSKSGTIKFTSPGDDYPLWDDVTEDVDYIVITGGSGFDADSLPLVYRITGYEIDGRKETLTVNNVDGKLKDSSDATYRVVSPYFVDDESPFTDSISDYEDYIIWLTDADDTDYPQYTYFTIKSRIDDDTVELSSTDISKILDENSMIYSVYSQKFIPIAFYLPDQEDSTKFFDDDGSDGYYRDIGDPEDEDLKTVNPILKVSSNVDTVYVPTDCYEVIDDGNGTPIVVLFSRFDIDDERLGVKEIVSNASVDPLVVDSFNFTDDNINFNSIGVQKNDIVEVIYDGSGDDVTNCFGGSGTQNRASVVSIVDDHTLKLASKANVNMSSLTYRILSDEFETGRLLCSYRVLRTSKVGDIIRAGNYVELNSLIPPVTPDNPLAWGMFNALVHSQGKNILGTMVDETEETTYYDISENRGDLSLDEVTVEEGTASSFYKAFEYLKSQDVYTITPLTFDTTVHQYLFEHVKEMSVPSRKRERGMVVTPRLELADIRVPYKLGTGDDAGSLVATSGGEYKKFTVDPDDSSVNFNSLGVLPGEWLQITSGGAKGSWKIDEVDGDKALILEKAPISMELAGLSWRIVSNMLDKSEQAEAIKSYAESFAPGLDDEGDAAYHDKRVVVCWPDYIYSSTYGNLPGYYLASGVAGMAAGYPAYQGFTNMSMSGYESLLHSNNYFTDSQLDTMATGGVYIVVQDRPRESVYCRHQLTAAFGLISTQEYSIIRDVDFIAKAIRTPLKRLIGVNNITDEFLGIVRMVVATRINSLISYGYLLSGTSIKSIKIDEDRPDTIIVELDLDVPYPVNVIKVYLYV